MSEIVGFLGSFDDSHRWKRRFSIRLEQDVERRERDLSSADRRDLPIDYQATQLAPYIALWVDRSQSLALIVTPILGIIVASNTAVRVLNGFALAIAAFVLIYTLLPSATAPYGARVGKAGISIVVAVAVAVNTVGLITGLAVSTDEPPPSGESHAISSEEFPYWIVSDV